MEGEKMSESCQRCLLCLLSLMPILICSLSSIRSIHHISEKERFPYFTFTHSAVHYSAPSLASETDLLSLPFPTSWLPCRHQADTLPLSGQHSALSHLLSVLRETCLPKGNGA